MNKVFKWLIGYVEFEYKNGFVEGFVNDCFDAKINVQGLSRTTEGVTGTCSIKSYMMLHRLAMKNGGVVRATKKYGLILPFLSIKNRWGLMVGAVCVVAIFCYLSGFVWCIDIVGNDRITTQEMVSFLEDNDFYVGKFSRSVERDMLEQLIMASFDDCAWAHINIDGTTAIVEIDEAIPKPEVVDDVITNVKASKDGRIIKATTYSGWQCVQNGDSVVKGDLLISGVYESEKEKENMFAHARGRVIAQVEEPFNLTISRSQLKRTYTSSRTYRSLNFFGLHIPIGVAVKNAQNADIERSEEDVMINNKAIPLGIITTEYNYYDVESVLLNDDELRAMLDTEMKRQLERDYGEYEIITQKIDININADEAVAKGKIVCIEDIAEEKILMKE